MSTTFLMENICVECRKSADCKRKPRTDQWTVAGCSSFEAYTTDLFIENRWIPLTFADGGLTSSIPDEYDGRWVIVTDGRLFSVERVKKDAYDHFFPSGRWFDLEDVTHWMPLPKPPKEETE